MITAQTILDFWFASETRAKWFNGGREFDKQLSEQFGGLLRQASAGELASWRENSAGRVAEIIVLDQFSRNIYRNTPQAFAQDGMALVLAQEALKQADFANLPIEQKHFALLPFMHSESKQIHMLAEQLFTELGNENALEFELKHKIIIDRFGRYPHRNAVLGRKSSAEELAFLQEEGSSF